MGFNVYVTSFIDIFVIDRKIYILPSWTTVKYQTVSTVCTGGKSYRMVCLKTWYLIKKKCTASHFHILHGCGLSNWQKKKTFLKNRSFIKFRTFLTFWFVVLMSWSNQTTARNGKKKKSHLRRKNMKDLRSLHFCDRRKRILYSTQLLLNRMIIRS